jgi:hypothetical protein
MSGTPAQNPGGYLRRAAAGVDVVGNGHAASSFRRVEGAGWIAIAFLSKSPKLRP